MTIRVSDSQDRAAAMRLEFDQAFAAPLRIQHDSPERLIAIVIGGDPWALAPKDIAGIVGHPKIVPVPSSTAAFLGVIGHRSSVVPVYALAPLLGYATCGAAQWVALVASGDNRHLGLAFEHYEGQYEPLVPGESANDQASAGVRRALRPVVAVASLLASILPPRQSA